ncbi:uncharacterized protein LOC117104700 [Anneissia japonica]|uniref:uncharacterized protein LOC117104700 n=1 Tax=Anneissia japonica TaxID=1529436 RepID=UPI0014258A48|nr:uncharacterized protein LOC117104700 [Anneissia japonica]
MEDVAKTAKTALQCSLKIRQGRKWKSRRCILSKRSPIAGQCKYISTYFSSEHRNNKNNYINEGMECLYDMRDLPITSIHLKKKCFRAVDEPGELMDQLTLSFYKDEDRLTKELRRERIIITDKNFCGIDSGHHYHGNSYITTVVCVDQIIALSFPCSSTQLQWYHRIKHSLKSLIEYKCKVVIPNRGKLPAGPAMLYFFDNHFAITSEVPIRLHGSWYLEDVHRYGTIAGGLLFQTKEKKRCCSHVLMTGQAGDLKCHFDAAFSTWLPNRWSHLSSTFSIYEEHLTRGRSATNNSAYSQQGDRDDHNSRNSGSNDGNGASSSYYQTSGTSREEGIGSGSLHEGGSSTCSSNSATPVKIALQNGNTKSTLEHIGQQLREYSQESGIDMHILPVVGQDPEVEETAVLPFKEQLYEVMASFKNLRLATSAQNASGIPKLKSVQAEVPKKCETCDPSMYVNVEDLPEKHQIARLNDRKYLQAKDAELLERVQRECQNPEPERNSKLITPKYQGLKIKDDHIQHQQDDILNSQVQFVKSSAVTHLQDHVDTYIMIPGVIPQTEAASMPCIEPPQLGPKPKSTVWPSDSETMKPQLGPKPKPKSEIKPELGPKPPIFRPELGPKPVPGPKPGQKPELGPKPEYGALPELGPKPELGALPELGPKPEHGALPELGRKPEYGALPDLGPKPEYSALPGLGPKPRSEFMQKLGPKPEQNTLLDVGLKLENHQSEDVIENNKIVELALTQEQLPENDIDKPEPQMTVPAPFEHDNLTIPTNAILLSQTVQSETKLDTPKDETSDLIVTKLSKSKKQKHSSPKGKLKRNFMRGRSGSLKSKPESYSTNVDKPIYRNRSASVMTFQFDTGYFDGSSQSSSCLSSPTGLEPFSSFEFSAHKLKSPAVDLDSVDEVDGSETYINSEKQSENNPEEVPLLSQGSAPPLPPKSANSLNGQRKAPPRPAKPSKIGNPFLAAEPLAQPVVPPRKRCQTEPSKVTTGSDGFIVLDPESKGDDGYALMKPAYLEKLQMKGDLHDQNIWNALPPSNSSLDMTLGTSVKTSGSLSHKFSFNVVPNSPIHTSVDVDTPVTTKPQLKRSVTMVGGSLVSPRMQRTYSLHDSHHVHESIRRGSAPIVKQSDTFSKPSSSNGGKPEKKRIPSIRPRTDDEYHALDRVEFEKIKNGFPPENSIRDAQSNGSLESVKTKRNRIQGSNEKVEKALGVSENSLSDILSITCSTGSSNELADTEHDEALFDTHKRKRCSTFGGRGANHIEEKNIMEESFSKFSLLNYESIDRKSSILGSIDKVFMKYSSYKGDASEGDRSGVVSDEVHKVNSDFMESAFID